MRSPCTLEPYPDNLTARLAHWAGVAPDRVFLAQRDRADAWRTLTYAAAFAAVRAIAAALLKRNLSPERPIAILSGNDIEHALLGLAAMHIGIPYAPISVPYSLVSQDFVKLRSIIKILTPGLVFAANGTAFARAIAATVAADIEVVITADPAKDRPATLFAELLDARSTPAVEAAHGEVGPETIAKILFTSGSTGQPKGVINSQRMLCSNQAMAHARLALHRRRQAAAGRNRGDCAQPARRSTDDLFQCTEGLRDACAPSARRSGALRKIFQPPQSNVLRRR
jgi:feruloyl-CoA synthase